MASREPIGVLYLIDSLPPTGGTEGQLAGLLERLDRARVRPHLATLRPQAERRPLPPDVPHLQLDVPRLLGLPAWREGRRLAAYLRQHRIPVVQTFFQDATVFGLWVARLAGVPVRLASFRDLGFWRTPRVEWLMRRAYPLASGFVVNSTAVRDHFVQADRLDARRFHVIGNGLDPAAIPFTAGREGPPTVLQVGNLNRPVKRADLFVAAAAQAGRPGVRWQLAGDGHLRPELEAQAARLGVGDRIDFLGRRSDIPQLLARATVSVNSSDTEGFSNAVLEAMLAGCPVVATDIGGNRELVTPGETGLLVPPGDAPALAAAITRLLDAPQERDALARTARRHVETHFSWTTTVARHQALYENLLAHHT